jgi:PEGA domain
VTKKPDDKGLMNEVLPDPTRGAGERGTPRERTAGHLKRLLAAGLALAPGLVHADTTTPGGKKPGDAGAAKPDDAKGKPPQPPQQPQQPSYDVVDPIPPPYIEKKAPPGFLNLRSLPDAEIFVDGKNTGLKTPQKKIKLNPGTHAITLKVPEQALEESFTVEIKTKETATITRKLEPPKKPAKDPNDK